MSIQNYDFLTVYEKKYIKLRLPRKIVQIAPFCDKIAAGLKYTKKV